jgi:hypothetical protein
MQRAEHYRDVAKRYLRLAASTEYPNHYLRIAVQYNALAESEELSADAIGTLTDLVWPMTFSRHRHPKDLDSTPTSLLWSSLSLIHDHDEASKPV